MGTFSGMLATCAFASAIFAGTAVAQRPAHRLGVVLGPNFARFGGDATEELQSRTAWFAGGFADLALSRNFSLGPELLYTRKGAKESHPDFTGTITLSYIEVPLLAKVTFPSGSPGPWAAAPHLYAGPAVAFRTGCTLDGSVEGSPVNVDCVDFAEPGVEFASLDASAIVGGGLDLGNIGVGIRYVLGLADITNQSDARNRVVSLYARYRMRLG